MQDVRDKVNAVIPSLPRDVRDPVFFKFDPNQSADHHHGGRQPESGARRWSCAR